MRVLLAACLLWTTASAQTAKDVREVAKTKDAGQIAGYLNSPDDVVRYEAVKALTDIGTSVTVDPLIRAAHDTNGDVQERAVDGLVNFYMPGYLPAPGMTSGIRAMGSGMKKPFSDPADQVIDPFVKVRTDVVTAIGQVASKGASINARVAAARAAGILRGQAAVPDLVEALRSKDSELIYQSLRALIKIRDPQAGPGLRFLLTDPEERVQLLAIEASGLLRDREAVSELEKILRHSGKPRVRRAALAAIAMMPEGAGRDLFVRYLRDKDETFRVAAAEGLARLANPADRPTVDKAFTDERKPLPRLALAFAQVMEGNQADSEYSPLRYLIYTLNSSQHGRFASEYLIEAATRSPELRAVLYRAMEQGTRDEKIYLARVFSQSGGRDAEAHLEKLSRDPDSAVAQEGLRALRTLRNRI